ncbi:MAG: urea carboxylase-associated family protein [Bdellovibrionaceae bacterium]|nr:urea carboxylase-associated family protein [Pseudobdellovibrionaceae bacterium]
MPFSFSARVGKTVKARLEPRTGVGFPLDAGQSLKVSDPFGGQVADLFCFDRLVPHDVLSSGRSIDENDTLALTKGHFLYGRSGRIMLEILEDSCGVHDFLITPCSLDMFQKLGNHQEHHPSCQENLENAALQGRHDPRLIGTAFNIFMNVPVAGNGRISIQPPRSKAGDFILFLAHRDLFVALTACSDEGTNNGACKPIDYEVFPVSWAGHTR